MPLVSEWGRRFQGKAWYGGGTICYPKKAAYTRAAGGATFGDRPLWFSILYASCKISYKVVVDKDPRARLENGDATGKPSDYKNQP